jgi:2-methylisocitrate lyase-like PEP mutase family enzyme
MNEFELRCNKFASLHQRGAPLFLPNCWDYASAAALAQAGYAAIGTTSAGVAAAAGKVDAIGAARAENVALAHGLSRLPIMLTVDIEAGMSDDPDAVADLAEELSDAGVVGINLEDGRPDRSLGSVELHCAKIAAVKSRTGPLFVNARTDAFWLADENSPQPTREAFERATAYVAAGADGIYIPGVADIETVRMLSSALEAPINFLYMPGCHTFRGLAEAGAARVSTGSLLFRETLKTVVATARAAWIDDVVPDADRPTYAQVQRPWPFGESDA